MVYKSSPGFKLNVVWTLILINFLLFVLTTIAPELIIPFLGLQPASFTARPWTILTSLFVHAGLWHILGNMLALYFFGGYLTSLIGRNKFLLVYFGGGILGSFLFILLAPIFAIAVGASGAIFAVGGALAIMRPRLPVMVFPLPVPLPLWVAVIGGFVLLSFLPNIAWQAHLGGIVFGLITGYFLMRRQRYFF